MIKAWIIDDEIDKPSGEFEKKIGSLLVMHSKAQ
jgi:hypothetical protein